MGKLVYSINIARIKIQIRDSEKRDKNYDLRQKCKKEESYGEKKEYEEDIKRRGD